MGLFGSIASALIGRKAKKSPQQDTSKPFHTHSSKSENKVESVKGEAPRPDPSFMGKNQVDSFQSLTDPLAVDRGGRAKSSQELDPVGIEPAMNPPLATPVDIDEQGINSLY
tara:strand:+ start:260 stop:595 length:336 start_codon:yes stop_codon:yes gene_type:complete